MTIYARSCVRGVFRTLVTRKSQIGILPEGRQIQAGCACLENRVRSNGGRSITDAFRHFASTKVNPMKPTLHYQSQLLPRRSYKPSRTLRIKPAPRPRLEFRPVNRFGAKPQIALVP